MTLREYIIDFRKKHDLSQRQFAELCGLSNGYVAMLEANKNPATGKPITPSIGAISKLATAMGTTFQTVMRIVETQNDYIVDEENLTVDEQELIFLYHAMTVEERNLFLKLARSMTKDKLQRL